jgi:hypothetical protein
MENKINKIKFEILNGNGIITLKEIKIKDF